jgi:hypothetical protein
MNSLAIISSSSKVDLAIVMAPQTARVLLVLSVGPFTSFGTKYDTRTAGLFKQTHRIILPKIYQKFALNSRQIRMCHWAEDWLSWRIEIAMFNLDKRVFVFNLVIPNIHNLFAPARLRFIGVFTAIVIFEGY